MGQRLHSAHPPTQAQLIARCAIWNRCDCKVVRRFLEALRSTTAVRTVAPEPPDGADGAANCEQQGSDLSELSMAFTLVQCEEDMSVDSGPFQPASSSWSAPRVANGELKIISTSSNCSVGPVQMEVDASLDDVDDATAGSHPQGFGDQRSPDGDESDWCDAPGREVDASSDRDDDATTGSHPEGFGDQHSPDGDESDWCDAPGREVDASSDRDNDATAGSHSEGFGDQRSPDGHELDWHSKHDRENAPGQEVCVASDDDDDATAGSHAQGFGDQHSPDRHESNWHDAPGQEVFFASDDNDDATAGSHHQGFGDQRSPDGVELDWHSKCDRENAPGQEVCDASDDDDDATAGSRPQGFGDQRSPDGDESDWCDAPGHEVDASSDRNDDATAGSHPEGFGDQRSPDGHELDWHSKCNRENAPGQEVCDASDDDDDATAGSHPQGFGDQRSPDGCESDWHDAPGQEVFFASDDDDDATAGSHHQGFGDQRSPDGDAPDGCANYKRENAPGREMDVSLDDVDDATAGSRPQGFGDQRSPGTEDDGRLKLCSIPWGVPRHESDNLVATNGTCCLDSILAAFHVTARDNGFKRDVTECQDQRHPLAQALTCLDHNDPDSACRHVHCTVHEQSGEDVPTEDMNMWTDHESTGNSAGDMMDALLPVSLQCATQCKCASCASCERLRSPKITQSSRSSICHGHFENDAAAIVENLVRAQFEKRCGQCPGG